MRHGAHLEDGGKTNFPTIVILIFIFIVLSLISAIVMPPP